jgi:sRNA-binding carbon storage regulator CsrA
VHREEIYQRIKGESDAAASDESGEH